jgi:hypothetical protein
MMVALLIYAYAIGERSSRALERRCREDVAFRVITANQVPDHATIARFRVRHEAALGELFGQVLGLCADGGLVSVGVIALEASKIAASASDKALRSYAQIAAEILEEAGRIDAARSCPSASPSARDGGHGCASHASASTASAPSRHSRSRASAAIGSGSVSAASSRTGRPSASQAATTRLATSAA